MQPGDLVEMKNTCTIWIALQIVYDSVLVMNASTNHKMWARVDRFEVISASR